MLKPTRIAGSVSILIILFLVFGCGSGSKGGQTTTVSGSTAASHDSAVNFTNIPFTAAVPTESMLLSGAPKAGATVCSNCHAATGSPIDAFTASLKKAAATDAGWINGPHANNNNSPSLSGLDSSCKACHDPVGDGSTVDAANSNGNTRLGTTNRPIVTCEACHGGGGNHFGLGPLPVAKPNALRCGRCHNGAMPSFHVTANSEVGTLYENYKGSLHASSIVQANFVTGSTTDVQALCSRCHTDEGAKAYLPSVNGTASYSDMIAALGNSSAIKDASVVQCRTCHDKHNPSRLLSSKASGLPAWSDEFATCTSCHQLLKADGTLLTQAYHAPYDFTGAVVNPTNGLTFGILPSTHYDDPKTDPIEGYIVNTAGDHAFCNGTSVSDGGVNKCGTCRDCHNPHSADITRNEQWAQSAHGGGLLTVKTNAVAADPKTLYTAAVKTTDDFGAPFVEDDFKAGSSICKRCHTSSGFRDLANNPTGFDLTQTKFVAAAGTSQREMIYCWACHNSNTGSLRNPGQWVIPDTVKYIKPSGRSLPTNLSGSFICVNCHQGRVTGAYVQTVTNLATAFSSFNSHYLSAGAVMFRIEGYEYAGQDYANPSSYLHDTIGISAANTGSNGPCVGCHMSTPESHLFLPVTKDSNDRITALNSNICKNCHGSTMTPTLLNSESDGYIAAKAALQAVLQAKGIYFFPANYPYYANKANPTINADGRINDGSKSGTNDQYTAWASNGVLGAAFNLNALTHEPGAYVHNRIYAKRLIFDSIDFLDDGQFNASVTATINASSLSADQKAFATAYLGSTRPQ